MGHRLRPRTPTSRARAVCVALVLSGLAAAGVLASGCSSDDASPSAPASHAASGVVGASGGDVETTGGVGVSVPAGALRSDVTITIDSTPNALPPSGGTLVGTPYTFGPEGTTFAEPVTVTLLFDPVLLPTGRSASEVVVMTAPAGSDDFTPLATTQVDLTHTSAAVSHFSVFVAFVPSAARSTDGGPSDAGVLDAATPPEASFGPEDSGTVDGRADGEEDADASAPPPADAGADVGAVDATTGGASTDASTVDAAPIDATTELDATGEADATAGSDATTDASLPDADADAADDATTELPEGGFTTGGVAPRPRQ